MQPASLVWRDQVAHPQAWPGDDSRTVADVFAEEQPRLLPHAGSSLSHRSRQPVRSAKTIYVRFDLNEYSIPPEAVGRQLTLSLPTRRVRILDGANGDRASSSAATTATNRCSIPLIRKRCSKRKRKAFQSTPGGRLEQLVPGKQGASSIWLSHTASRRAVRDRATARTAGRVWRMRPCGAPSVEALERAIRRALLRSRFCCAGSRDRPRVALDFSRHPEAQALDVRPHDLETYDELARHEDETGDE